MRRITKVVVISLFVFESSAQVKELDTHVYSSCDSALSCALEDISAFQLKFYQSGYGSLANPKFGIQYDSILFSNYNVSVIRNGNFMVDHTQRCYNQFIAEHLDSIALLKFGIDNWGEMRLECWNEVMELNGVEPLTSDDN